MFRTMTLKLSDGASLTWSLDFSEAGTLRLNTEEVRARCPWVRLAYKQCSACTLSPADTPTCPVSDILAGYAVDLADRMSWLPAEVHLVDEASRHIVMHDVPLQRIVGELVRLAVFQSGCPVGRKVKPAMVPLAPFPSSRGFLEALAHYFACETSEEPNRVMHELHELFGCLAKRFECAGEGDTFLNAVVVVHSLSTLFALSAPELIRKAMERHLSAEFGLEAGFLDLPQGPQTGFAGDSPA